MDFLLAGIGEAIMRIARLDADLINATSASLIVSGTATGLAVVSGIPIGALLGLSRFRGRGLALALANTGMGLPPVAVGLFVAILVWRSGPLGGLEWFCSRQAMVAAQYILAVPTVIGLTAVAVQSVDPLLQLQLRGIGASRGQVLWLIARESRLLLLTAAMAGFGAVISEIGASLMVGCNIRGDTRILTTAIALETSRGEFGTAIALALVLLTLILSVIGVTTWLQQRQTAE